MAAVWGIVYDEGSRQIPDAKASARSKGLVMNRRKGQGVQGLYRGWRVGMWGILGVWGAAALGSGGRVGGEF